MSERPRENDPAVIAAGVDAMWPRIAEWLSDGAPTDEAEVAHTKRTLCDAYARAFDHDAYDVARRLEGEGWEPDADLVDELDSGAWKIHRAHNEAVEAWVKAGGVAVGLPVGTSVKHRSLDGHVGKIVSENAGGYDSRKRGDYLVFCAALGHVRPGTPEYTVAIKRDGNATMGIYLHAEDVEVVAP